MTGTVFLKNGRLEPVAAATVSLDDVNFAYGYGVYETLKLRGGVLYFPERHEERLFHSARVIGLDHALRPGELTAGLEALVRANGLRDSNIKVLLVGRGDAGADLYALQLNPLYPKRTDYRDGAAAVAFRGERAYPEAKTLNMLVSTIAFRQAKAAGAYDALLENRDGHLTEGTRTNLFYTDGAEIYTPPDSEILAGVTRQTVVACMAEAGLAPVTRPLLRSELETGRFVGDDGQERPLAGLFLTSTSTKVMPLARVHEAGGTGGRLWSAAAVPENVRGLMKDYDRWLAAYAASREPLV